MDKNNRFYAYSNIYGQYLLYIVELKEMDQDIRFHNGLCNITIGDFKNQVQP